MLSDTASTGRPSESHEHGALLPVDFFVAHAAETETSRHPVGLEEETNDAVPSIDRATHAGSLPAPIRRCSSTSVER
jgi:hypothetical protein